MSKAKIMCIEQNNGDGGQDKRERQKGEKGELGQRKTQKRKDLHLHGQKHFTYIVRPLQVTPRLAVAQPET